jgi:hypothetical protein
MEYTFYMWRPHTFKYKLYWGQSKISLLANKTVVQNLLIQIL